MSKSPDDIAVLANKLRAVYSTRDFRYGQNYYAYKGEFYKIADGYLPTDGSDKRYTPDDSIQVWNLIYPLVETRRLLMNRLPSINVPPPVLGDQVAAAKSSLLEKALYGVWDASKMTRKHGEAAFNIGLNNASVWFPRWDMEIGHPIITTRSPGETYPMTRRGGDELSYCLFRWEEDAEVVAEEYPEARSILEGVRPGSQQQVEVIEYVDRSDYCIVVHGKRKSLFGQKPASHNLGFCPVVVVPGSQVGGELFPMSAIDQLVAMNDYLNRFQTKWGDALEQVLFGWHMYEADEDVPFNTGPGAVNRMPQGANYQYVQPSSPPREVFAHLQQVESIMRKMSLWPESASGESDASVITGKAVSRLQGVMTAAAAEAQTNLADGLSEVNQMVLKMMERYEPKKKFTFYGSAAKTGQQAPGRPQSFVVELIPEQNIDGYYRNQLFYSPFGADFERSIVTGLQMVQADLVPRSWLRDQIPGIGDTEGMEKEIEEEKTSKMELELKLQTEAQKQLLQAQTEQQMALAQQQAQMQGAPQGQSPTGNGGGGGAPAPEASGPGGAPAGPPPKGMTPPNLPGQTPSGGGPIILPTGQPMMMGEGQPWTGAENLPLPFVDVKPFDTALNTLNPSGKPGKPGQPQQGQELPEPGQVSAEDVVKAIREIKNLKGEVFLMGEIARRGSSTGNIEIALTNGLDKATIANYMKANHPELYGRFKFMTVDQPPANGIPVTEGGKSGVPQAAQATA